MKSGEKTVRLASDPTYAGVHREFWRDYWAVFAVLMGNVLFGAYSPLGRLTAFFVFAAYAAGASICLRAWCREHPDPEAETADWAAPDSGRDCRYA